VLELHAWQVGFVQVDALRMASGRRVGELRLRMQAVYPPVSTMRTRVLGGTEPALDLAAASRRRSR